MPSGGGSVRTNDLIAGLILANIILILWFIIDYLFNKKKRDFKYFFIQDDNFNYFQSTMRTMAFSIFNGLAIFTYLADKISNHL